MLAKIVLIDKAEKMRKEAGELAVFKSFQLAVPGQKFVYFQSFQTLVQFYYKKNLTTIHLISNAGIQTHYR